MSEAESPQRPTELPSSPNGIRFSDRPIYLLLTTAALIFVSEALVMVLLEFLPPLASYQEALFDAALLSFTVFPSLYFLVFRPMRRHIARRRQIEAEKDTLINELQKALDEVKTLRGIIPICASCKKIRDDKGFWQQVEVYVSAHSDAKFSSGVCPDCAKKLYPEIV